jgi:hypothetical protein
METAHTIADNAPMVNYLIVNALPRIADMSTTDGLFTESLAASLSHNAAHANDGMRDFLARSQVTTKETAVDSLEAKPDALGNSHDPI